MRRFGCREKASGAIKAIGYTSMLELFARNVQTSSHPPPVFLDSTVAGYELVDLATRRDRHRIKPVSRLLCNFKTSRTLSTPRPLSSETTSTPIQLYDSELPRVRTVRHPIGFTAADIFQVRSEDFGHRRTGGTRSLMRLMFVSSRRFAPRRRWDFE